LFLIGSSLTDCYFICSYINIPYTLILYFGWKIWKRTSIVPYETMDISSHYEEGSVVYSKHQ
jgi:yeast amino acid transporter